MSFGGGHDGGEVIPLRGRREPAGLVTEDQAARLLRNFYRAYSRGGEDMEPSDRQVEAMIDALVLTFELRLVLS